MDFNPAANALRIVGDTGQDLRHPFAGATAGVTQNDGGLNYIVNNSPVTATGITGAAYTNNDLDANTATTLFDVDSLQDQVAIQSPPNADHRYRNSARSVAMRNKFGPSLAMRGWAQTCLAGGPSP